MRSKFLKSQNTIGITHEWGTSCNLKCSFCYNTLKTNLNSENIKNINFKIVEMASKIKKDILFYETGGELLTCNYFEELMDYKIQMIKNYKGLFFTNATYFEKFKIYIDKYEDFLEPILSFHPLFMSDKDIDEFVKSMKYTIEKYGYVNMNIVYYKGMDIDKLFNILDCNLKEHCESIHLKILINTDLMGSNTSVLKEMFTLRKIYTKLDDDSYVYRRCLKHFNDIDSCFKDKMKDYITYNDKNLKLLPEIDIVANNNQIDVSSNFISNFKDFYTHNIDEFVNELNNFSFENVLFSDENSLYNMIQDI